MGSQLLGHSPLDDRIHQKAHSVRAFSSLFHFTYFPFQPLKKKLFPISKQMEIYFTKFQTQIPPFSLRITSLQIKIREYMSCGTRKKILAKQKIISLVDAELRNWRRERMHTRRWEDKFWNGSWVKYNGSLSRSYVFYLSWSYLLHAVIHILCVFPSVCFTFRYCWNRGVCIHFTWLKRDDWSTILHGRHVPTAPSKLLFVQVQ